MRDLRNAPSTWIRGWVALLAVAGCANVSCALAQIYKCTDADGRTAFSDKPCATEGSGAGKGGVKQDVLRQPRSSAPVSADTISAMCAKQEGSPPSDEIIKSLPEAQRKAVIQVLRGVVASVARDPAGRESLKRATMTIDSSQTAVICVPWRRAQPSGATGPTITYTAFKVEPNGRTEALVPSQPPQVANDANEPATMASRCSSLVTSCVRSQPKTPASIDPCFEKAPVCPGGQLDPAATCCPQTCKDAYRRERTAGTDPESAFIKVIYGDDAGAASCIPGMPRRG